MSNIIDNYFFVGNINFTTYLISQGTSADKIRNQINSLNLFQSLYTFNKVIENNYLFEQASPLLNKKILYYFFQFDYTFNHVNINHTSQWQEIITSLENNYLAEDSILLLLKFENFFRDRMKSLMFEIIQNLKKYKITSDNEFLINYFTKQITTIIDGGNTPPVFQSIVLIANQLKSLLKINENHQNYKNIMLFPLMHDINSWKQLVTKKIENSNTAIQFTEEKLFFINCINEFRKITKESSYFNYCGDYSVGEEIPVFDCDEMKDWINNTFTEFKKTNAKYSKTEKNKIEISDNYNQQNLVKTLFLYANYHNQNIDIKIFEGIVSNYTIVTNDKNEKAHYSKFINQNHLLPTNKISQKSVKDIILLFLILKKHGVIKTGINKLRQTLSEIFKGIPGASSSNIKVIWEQTNLNLEINKKFWYELKSIYPSLKNHKKNITLIDC